MIKLGKCMDNCNKGDIGEDSRFILKLFKFLMKQAHLGINKLCDHLNRRLPYFRCKATDLFNITILQKCLFHNNWKKFNITFFSNIDNSFNTPIPKLDTRTNYN